MSEFKGTKGKWNIEPPVAKGSWIGNENGYSALSCGNTNEENRANALLISKAPEMLEMLKKDFEYLEELAMCIPARFWTEEFRDKWNKEMHEKEQLIKQATGL